MAEEQKKRLRRSDSAIIGGVCAGIAEYFSIDPVIVRAIAVILLVIGWGLPAIIYLVMMVVMPRAEADYTAYIDVDPIEPPKTKVDGSGRVAGAPVPPSGAYVPPIPNPNTSATASGGHGTMPNADSNPGAAYSATYGVAYDAGTNTSSKRKGSWYNLPVLLIGLMLIGIGLSAIVGRFVPGIEWFSFWPLIVIVCGCVVMFTRGGEPKWTPVRLFDGLLIISVGLILLACTTDFFGWHVIDELIALWPVFLIACGVCILAGAIHSKIIQCLGILLFIGGLVLGCVNYYYGMSYLNTDSLFGTNGLSFDKLIVLDSDKTGSLEGVCMLENGELQ